MIATALIVLSLQRSASTPVQDLLLETNRERVSIGLKELKENEKLSGVAQSMADDLLATQRLSHTDSQGRNLRRRVDDSGYPWRRIAENLASGQESAKEAVKDLMASETHKRNIVNAVYTEIGVGFASSKNGEFYWVQVFGTR